MFACPMETTCFVVSDDYHIYTNFLFYLALAVYFILQKEFSFSEWKNNILGGRKFWVPVIITAAGFMAAFAVTILLEGAFPGLDAGMFLYAVEHALSPWGILLVMIWALPLSISYMKTKNVYIPMTAHFIVNLLGNRTDVIFTAAALLK